MEIWAGLAGEAHVTSPCGRQTGSTELLSLYLVEDDCGWH